MGAAGIDIIKFRIRPVMEEILSSTINSLPDDLKALIDRQARVFNNASWELIVDELIRIIERHLTKTRSLALTVTRAKERHQQTSAG